MKKEFMLGGREYNKKGGEEGLTKELSSHAQC